jgi:hypothetical protein
MAHRSTYQGHTIAIKREDDDTWTLTIDGRITSPGWAYRGSAFEYAQIRISELNAAK